MVLALEDNALIDIGSTPPLVNDMVIHIHPTPSTSSSGKSQHTGGSWSLIVFFISLCLISTFCQGLVLFDDNDALFFAERFVFDVK